MKVGNAEYLILTFLWTSQLGQFLFGLLGLSIAVQIRHRGARPADFELLITRPWGPRVRHRVFHTARPNHIDYSYMRHLAGWTPIHTFTGARPEDNSASDSEAEVQIQPRSHRSRREAKEIRVAEVLKINRNYAHLPIPHPTGSLSGVCIGQEESEYPRPMIILTL